MTANQSPFGAGGACALTEPARVEVGGAGNSSMMETDRCLLLLVLGHVAEYLNIVSLGRLTSCNKFTNELVQQAACWQTLFTEAVQDPTGYTTDHFTLGMMQGMVQSSWNKERGVLPAFADLRLAEAVGFKKAFKCLVSTDCEVCKVIWR
jgi:hypothetical protein